MLICPVMLPWLPAEDAFLEGMEVALSAVRLIFCQQTNDFLHSAMCSYGWMTVSVSLKHGYINAGTGFLWY